LKQRLNDLSFIFPDHMHPSNVNPASIKNNSTMYVFPNQHKVLPCTPTCLPEEGADMRLVDYSQDFSYKVNVFLLVCFLVTAFS